MAAPAGGTLSRGAFLNLLTACSEEEQLSEINQEPFTLTVLGHQIVQSAEAKGLLLRTAELGVMVFSLPEGILQRLIANLASPDFEPLTSQSDTDQTRCLKRGSQTSADMPSAESATRLVADYAAACS